MLEQIIKMLLNSCSKSEIWQPQVVNLFPFVLWVINLVSATVIEFSNQN